MLSSTMDSNLKKRVRKSAAERRQEILDATLKLISQRGVEGATVTRIAAAVGLTPGALYRHFDSRASLITEANKLANELALSWVEASTAPDAMRRLEEVGDAQAAWARENFSTVVRPLFMELASSPDPDAGDRLTLPTFKSFRALVAIAEEGRRQGVIHADVPPEDVAWALHMFAWTQDIALMAGADEAVDLGAIRRNLGRMLESFRA
jgi:AcrR family transcriptional regulator